MMVEEDGVAEDRALVQHAQAVHPLDRREPVAAVDLVELGHALADVDLELQAALHREVVAVLQEPGRAGVDLCWAEHAAEPTRGMLPRPLDQPGGTLEPLAARLLVPLIG